MNKLHPTKTYARDRWAVSVDDYGSLWIELISTDVGTPFTKRTKVREDTLNMLFGQ